MGGHRAGEVASATALEALRAAVASGQPLRDAIEGANDAVLEKSAVRPELRGMGTTLTAGTLGSDGTLLVGHVGDSRAYLAPRRRARADHRPTTASSRSWSATGELTAEQAAVHPQRSIITRALGVDPAVEVDVYPIELQPGDRILFCSDGLTDMVRAGRDRRASSRREPDPKRAAQLLVDAANAAGGEDNITAVIVEAVEVPDDEVAARRPFADDDTSDDAAGEAAAPAGAHARFACSSGCSRCSSCWRSRSSPSAGTRARRTSSASIAAG